MPKCELCATERSEGEGQNFSPRDLSGMEPKIADEKTVSLHSMASSVIMFNNPPGSADTPMWWICSQCISSCFSRGRTKQSLQMEESLFSLVAGVQQKKWWQFWK